MLKKTLHTHATETSGPQLRDALNVIGQIILDGLCHGYFRCSISSEIGKNNRRELVIEAGKSHKFTVPEDELPRCSRTAIPGTGDAVDANQSRVQRHRWDSEAGAQEHGTAASRP
jgi:hypothetical protein